MKKRYNKVNWNSMDPVEVWRIVRKGKRLKVFPNGYLNQDICKVLVRELLLNELKMNREKILTVNNSFLAKYHLGGVRKFFDSKIYKLLIFSFPELEINEWEVKKTSPDIWKDSEIRNKYVRYIAKKENINLSEISDLKKFSTKMIMQKYKGSKAIAHAGGLFELIKPVIPEHIKEWEIFKVSKWDLEKAKEALNWLIHKRLKWSEEDIYNNLSASIFYSNNLGGLLCKFCNNSPLQAIQIIYPNIKKLKNERPPYLRKTA